jgi:hypothetical protein
MSMIALSGTRMSNVKVWPSGLANACTVTSRGMSCADTRATPVTRTMRIRAARRAALETATSYLVELEPGQTTPWCGFETGAIPL